MFSDRGSTVHKFMTPETEFERGISASELKINNKAYTLACGVMGVEFYNEVVDPEYPDEPL